MGKNDLNIESVNKFESMLKTNSFLFFDSNEFEEITMYYLDMGNISLAKKANDLSIKSLIFLFASSNVCPCKSIVLLFMLVLIW